MLNLRETKNDQIYKVTWMVGDLAEEMRQKFDLHESEHIQVVRNMGKNGVIIRYGSHRLAMDPSAAFTVKVESYA